MCFDLRYMIGGIGDLHDQPSIPLRPHPNDIGSIVFPHLFIPFSGTLETLGYTIQPVSTREILVQRWK